MEIALFIFLTILAVLLVSCKLSFPRRLNKYYSLIIFVTYLVITGFNNECCDGCSCSCKTIETKYKIKIVAPQAPVGMNVNDCMNFSAWQYIDWQQIYNNHWVVKIVIDPSGTQSNKCYQICNIGTGVYNGNVVDCSSGGFIQAFTFNISGMNNEYLEFDAICNAKFILKVYIKTNCGQCNINTTSTKRYSWLFQKELEFCKDKDTTIEFTSPVEQGFEDCWSNCQW